jgi:hypothetical protein
MEEVYIRPGLTVEESWDTYFTKLLSSPQFFYLFVFQSIILGIILWSLTRNRVVIDYINSRGHPAIEIIAFLLLLMLLLPAFITYHLIREGNTTNYKYIWYSLLIYDIFILLWSVTVLFARTDLGTGCIIAVFFFFCSIWYFLVHLRRELIPILILFLFLNFYLCYYTYVIAVNPIYRALRD